MSTQSEIIMIVNMIGAAYPNFSPTKETISVYCDLLKDLDIEELKIAAVQCCSEPGRKFAPSVGELRGAVLEIRKAAMNIPSSYEAWEEVLQQATVTGHYRTPEFSHPLITRAVKAIGWYQICMSEMPAVERSRFIQCYEQFVERAESEMNYLPAVKSYIQDKGGKLLNVTDEIKKLTGGMRK